MMKSIQETFTVDELEALKSLIEFHDDWEHVSELLNVNVQNLWEKITDSIVHY